MIKNSRKVAKQKMRQELIQALLILGITMNLAWLSEIVMFYQVQQGQIWSNAFFLFVKIQCKKSIVKIWDPSLAKNLSVIVLKMRNAYKNLQQKGKKVLDLV
jgi:hypothetical protein